MTDQLFGAPDDDDEFELPEGSQYPGEGYVFIGSRAIDSHGVYFVGLWYNTDDVHDQDYVETELSDDQLTFSAEGALQSLFLDREIVLSQFTPYRYVLPDNLRKTPYVTSDEALRFIEMIGKSVQTGITFHDGYWYAWIEGARKTRKRGRSKRNGRKSSSKKILNADN